MRKLIIFSITIGILSQVTGIAQEKQWDASWESLKSREYPQWFKDAKLGIFIHWGIYSVPAYGGLESYGEWYLRGLQVGDSLRINFMKNRYGENFKYRDFAPLFKAELYNPDEWAELFKRSGAKYIIFVSKHHDGYCLWPSKYAHDWNSVDVGPQRDLVGELAEAVRKTDVKFGLYYSLAEWNHPLHKWYTDPNDSIKEYVDKHMIPQFRELIGNYKPKVLFTDGEWFNSAEEWHARELISWYYNLVGDEAIVNDRWGSGSDIGFLTPEYSSGIKVTDRPWAEVRGLGRSFGLNRNEPLDAYMSPGELIHFFVKAVANGGGITINVGPKADGQIPLLQQERLIQLGEWLNVNGEAIYGSEVWKKPGEEKEVTVERIDPRIDFNWVRNKPDKLIKEDFFNITWTGYIKSEFSENYLFEAEANEGIRMWINGTLVIDQWEKVEKANASEETIEKDSIYLQKGKMYPVKINYHEKRQDANAQLFWSSKLKSKEIIPQKNLFSSRNTVEGDGLKGVYRSMKQYIAYTRNHGNLYAITLEWPNEELVLSINKPASDTKVTMLGRDGELPWKYENNKMYIDISGIKYNEIPNHYAWSFRIENME